MKFTELKLAPEILEALDEMGFEELTPIQELTYPIIASGTDLCALAETGSGKTAACAIPLVEKMDPSESAIQGLVIVPTRELCIQYVHDIQAISKKTEIKTCPIYGGAKKSLQVSRMNQGVHILVATPGRLIDFMMAGIVDLQKVKCAILDEADELLNVGFFDDIKFIMSCIIQKHQTLLFSATMDDAIKKLAHDCLHDPKHITLIHEQKTPSSLEHCFQFVPRQKKEEVITKFIEETDMRQCIIFCNARHEVDKIYKMLKSKFDKVDAIHAGLFQDKRSIIFKKFKNEKIKYLIATDVAGRGLDFSHVTHVINWDFPGGEEQYTHRTGRAGRMGREGLALTFITRQDLKKLRLLLKAKKIEPKWIGKDPLTESPQPSHGKPKKRPFRKRRPPKKKP